MHLPYNQRTYPLPLLFILILILSSNLSFSQQAIPVAGGNQEGMGGAISYSIGQITFKDFTSDSGSIAEGVQHPYESLIVSVTDNFPEQNLNIKAFPNPFNADFTLYADEDLLRNLRFEILDAGGKLLLSGQVLSTESRIEMNNLTPGMYMLRVYQSEKELKVFKVLKR